MKHLLLILVIALSLSACDDSGALVQEKKNVLLSVKNYAGDGTYEITQYLYTPEGNITGTEIYTANNKLISYAEYIYSGNKLTSIATHLATDKSKTAELKFTTSDKNLVTRIEAWQANASKVLKKAYEQAFEYNTNGQLLKTTVTSVTEAPFYEVYTYESNNIKSATRYSLPGKEQQSKWTGQYDVNKNPYYKLNPAELGSTMYNTASNLVKYIEEDADGNPGLVTEYSYTYDAISHLPLKKYIIGDDGKKKLVAEFEYR